MFKGIGGRANRMQSKFAEQGISDWPGLDLSTEPASRRAQTSLLLIVSLLKLTTAKIDEAKAVDKCASRPISIAAEYGIDW